MVLASSGDTLSSSGKKGVGTVASAEPKTLVNLGTVKVLRTTYGVHLRGKSCYEVRFIRNGVNTYHRIHTKAGLSTNEIHEE